ncbi:hypothetical protein AAFN86_00895 [Roseomonas sp. CAU 1739]|uniref:hypothetical protein n=1 Tax=Roseomonas sp. CAU 1739 TaxID=3140364 RepID=UPI00325AF577
MIRRDRAWFIGGAAGLSDRCGDEGAIVAPAPNQRWAFDGFEISRWKGEVAASCTRSYPPKGRGTRPESDPPMTKGWPGTPDQDSQALTDDHGARLARP